ncbi:hypothetical protein LQ938_00525 [Microbacterium sp. cx-55]|uniref:hypothetical protein n=1 Tax=unclassified Microbacterium TaxID=2609290 RepID=UPI001CBBDF61|nr:MULTISPECIES: hypothetical protein [unclassified Microbacterium]MBZ4487289.1 hypothetical protein [Microbacterium sp. cx-55]MCC4908594.1 hypothetical protein [Microbacterium sp. cx-59]UGB35311.1 hypothetical protein LQ938_00525 [Microbacterium sp. cx-55]
MTPVGYGGVLNSTIASQSNSLIVAPEMPGWMDGVGPFEDGMTLGTSLQSGDWVAASLAMGSIALSVVDAVLNPIATLVSLGVGWMLEHIWPLTDWLNSLTGDHRMVSSYAATWQNVSTSVSASADALNATLADLADMRGFAVDAEQRMLETMANSLGIAAQLASGVGVAVELLSTIVKAVHDLVRDAISDLVGYVVVSLAEVAATLGAATPFVAAQLAVKATKWSTLLMDFVMDLVKSAGTYVDLAKSLKEVYDGVTGTLNEKVA